METNKKADEEDNTVRVHSYHCFFTEKKFSAAFYLFPAKCSFSSACEKLPKKSGEKNTFSFIPLLNNRRLIKAKENGDRSAWKIAAIEKDDFAIKNDSTHSLVIISLINF